MRKSFLPRIALVVVALSSLARAQTAATSPTGYHAEKTIKVGGAGRWDYLTVSAEHLLYVTRSTHEQVIDPAAGKVIADIECGGGLHGTALVPSAGRAFITDGEGAKILVVDLKTNTLLGKIDAAEDADGIIYDAGSDRLLVSCGDANQLLVLDPKADVATAKVEKIELGGKPEFLAADGKGWAFVCINDKNLVAVVDLKTLKVIDRWPCGSGTAPAGLAVDLKKGRLFAGCRNQKLIVLDTSSGKVVAELPIGKGNDACVFDEQAGLAFASCGDGTLSVIGETSTGTLAVEETITTPKGSRTMAIDPATHKLYVPTADFMPAEQGKRPAAVPNSFGIAVMAK